MILEQQVCSLELAKRLKGLGVKQESLYHWATFRNESSPREQWANVYSVVISEDEIEDHEERRYLKDLSFCSAFTVAELGEMLPAEYCNSFKANPKAIQNERHQDWGCCRHDDRDTVFGDTEADARAKMLIYLIENKLVNPKTL